MNELIKKLTQFLPSFSFRLDGNKRLALLAAAAIAATAIIVSVLWNSNHGYVSLYGSQEHLPVSQIVTVLDGEKLEYRIDPQSGQILVPGRGQIVAIAARKPPLSADKSKRIMQVIMGERGRWHLLTLRWR